MNRQFICCRHKVVKKSTIHPLFNDISLNKLASCHFCAIGENVNCYMSPHVVVYSHTNIKTLKS